MLDLKGLADHLIINRLINTEGEKVNWLKIKILRYEKKYTFVIQHKYNYSDHFKCLNVKYVSRPSRVNKTFVDIKDIGKKYAEPSKISCSKKKDLMELC